jgi:hypothetical protein
MHGECPCIECFFAQQVGRNRYASIWLNGGYDADLPIFGVEGGRGEVCTLQVRSFVTAIKWNDFPAKIFGSVKI